VIGRAQKPRIARLAAFSIVLLCRLAVADVQVESAPESGPEAAALASRLHESIAQAPASTAAINVRVTVGRTALENAIAANDPRPIIAAYVTSSEYEAALAGRERLPITAVFSNPDPRDQAALARALLGGSSLAAFDTAASHQLIQMLGGSARAIPASGEQTIDSLLRAADSFDAIIALPDPTVLNRSNINHVVRTLYERRKVLIGYSATLTRVGALASVHVSPEALARSVVAVLDEYAARGTLPAPVFVNDVDVTVNERLARSLNIAIPDRARLLDAIRSRRNEGTP
jgi:hypothetical protein